MTRSRLWTAMLLLVAGCGSASRVELSQPQLRGMQRNVKLSTETAVLDTDGAVRRVLAEFPLPGATTGRPTFALYLRFPADTDAAEFAKGLRGFLVQIRGINAGLTPIVGGRIRQQGSAKVWRVNLKFEDGSRMTGELRTKEDAHRLRVFEKREHAADIRILLESTPPTP